MSELLAKKKKKKNPLSPRSRPPHSRDNCGKGFHSKMLQINLEGEKEAEIHLSITTADFLKVKEKLWFEFRFFFPYNLCCKMFKITGGKIICYPLAFKTLKI